MKQAESLQKGILYITLSKSIKIKEFDLKPRVGHIQFLNCLPLYYGLVKSHALLDIELIKGNPTELNNLLINGELDISPISSIEYARNYKSLMLFPDFTVSSDKEVKSIILLSRFPLDGLSGKKIALTSTSATSHVLLKLILSAYNIKPEYFIAPPEPERMLEASDACLLIGDIALKYYLNGKSMYVYDLGYEWNKLTGHKMVYAVWAINRDFALNRKELCKYVFDLFKKSMEYSMNHLQEISDYAERWEPFSSNSMMEYFRSLHFGFEREYQEGLIFFYNKAVEIGELSYVPELDFFDTTSSIR
jgi:chorismate dehydratase